MGPSAAARVPTPEDRLTALAWTLAALLAVACVALLVALAASRRRAAEASPATAAVEDLGHDRGATSDAFARTPVLALVVDADARLVDATRAARARFPFLRGGLSLLEAFGQHLLVAPVREALAEGTPRRFSVGIFADGMRRFLVDVVPYDAGSLRRAVILLDDQTPESSYQELRSQFVANVSHELRTPLTGLSAILETLADPDLDPATRDRFVDRARRETARLSALIADTLFLSEIEASEATAELGPSDLVAVAHQVLEESSERAAAASVSLDVHAAGACWVALTDRLAHALIANLVENAVRYAGPSTNVLVTVERRGAETRLVVADDGAGIDQRHLPHLFERFYRADPSRSKELGGTGLGLSIVKHIAEHVGGKAEVSSRVGRGTTITVTLPATDPPSAHPE